MRIIGTTVFNASTLSLVDMHWLIAVRTNRVIHYTAPQAVEGKLPPAHQTLKTPFSMLGHAITVNSIRSAVWAYDSVLLFITQSNLYPPLLRRRPPPSTMLTEDYLSVSSSYM